MRELRLIYSCLLLHFALQLCDLLLQLRRHPPPLTFPGIRQRSRGVALSLAGGCGCHLDMCAPSAAARSQRGWGAQAPSARCPCWPTRRGRMRGRIPRGTPFAASSDPCGLQGKTRSSPGYAGHQRKCSQGLAATYTAFALLAVLHRFRRSPRRHVRDAS